MAKKGIILFTVFFLLAPLSGFGRSGEGSFVLKRHEISVSGAFFQNMYINTPQLLRDNDAFLSDDYIRQMFGVSEYDKGRMTGSWKIDYTYNFSKVFALGVGFDYEGYRDNFYNSEGGAKTKVFYGDILGLMATLRVSWKNARLVRVYSSAGIGASVMLSGADYSPSGATVVKYDNDFNVDWEVVPVGMSIGRGLFGFVELGVGTVYVGGRFGVGYRF